MFRLVESQGNQRGISFSLKTIDLNQLRCVAAKRGHRILFCDREKSKPESLQSLANIQNGGLLLNMAPSIATATPAAVPRARFLLVP
jgi:hypothetical protein